MYSNAITSVDILAQLRVTVLEPGPYSINTVGPESVNELVLPSVATLGYRVVVGIYEHAFNSCGAKLNAEYAISGFNY